MLPEIVLDDENFDDILEEARGKIASLYPEWTDYNFHDPGITLLELFSCLQESQQYYMDQIGIEQKMKFLKLLGEKRNHKKPASVLVNVDTKKSFTLPERTKLYAKDICFESVGRNYMVRDDIVKCFFAREQNLVELLDKKQLNFGHKFKMYMFGKKPVAGDCFYIGMDVSLPENTEISIYFEFLEDYKVKRNPVKGKIAYPFVQYEAEYYTAEGWKKVGKLKDKTNGFIISGQIFFQLDSPMKKENHCGQDAFFLRLRLTSGAYDVPPIVESFGINVFAVRQTDHIINLEEVKSYRNGKEEQIFFQGKEFMTLYGCNELYYQQDQKYYKIPSSEKYWDENNQLAVFVVKELPVKTPSSFLIISYFSENGDLVTLEEGNGFPNQEYDLYDLDLEYESFEIMVQDIVNPEAYVRWKKVNDFGESGPEDTHYVLDTENGRIRFGDGFHGLPPEGRIRIVCYVKTLGKGGNVKANNINCFSDKIKAEATVRNDSHSDGGMGEELLEDSFLRIKNLLRHSVTAVTYEDYERYIRNTPGLMIANCKVLPRKDIQNLFPYLDESAVSIAVKPYSSRMEKKLSSIYHKNIMNYLEHFRMAGTSIHILPPAYISISLYLEIVIKPQYIDGREMVKREVEEFFEKIENEFGAMISYSRLYGKIDLLDCVSYINGLSLEAKGTGVTFLQDQSIVLPPNGIAELEHAEYLFTMEK